ncbi:MAG: 5-formyltetrahydrofolate cyclo-ligase [uncultured bacterium]|nr:MAG: 5-formyltetrahydrofolate cyclo-ligase [uncultured bacterium]OGJ47813.1 MAG: 5-formyltetrahydrofolate cyclo-ligase [Candidatus Peregrinibacteria bacterium RIFOXYA2_FULL_41_18]OGJ48369.1 MAG: 5-formyltetrahydrofolate cyclo-ligase [Candidatus Peregrinibacteria bacterium RIFOXYB12_FULL_41_12]OGJ53008.1 MAG: 5-formyltetrahydrofolate cyclo-ligase [Candidatus Peregrinibacteria bacterium RIFOXYC2_FULL_41_22]OGJ53592.1 MAG: 5-formyltetrahydrofolate cyclo-ligase [Candidatus Peregrinibacteria bact
MHEKHNIRQEVKKKRKQLGFFKKRILDAWISKSLQNFKSFKEAKTVLFYTSMPEEIDTLKLIKKFIHDKNIILPTVCHDTHSLKLYHLTHVSELHKGYQGILEIPHCTKDTHDHLKIDLCIIPGLAFDMEGNRIGYGKGFFDGLLKKIHAPKIALAYDFQIHEHIPYEEHDIKITHIITPTQIISI